MAKGRSRLPKHALKRNKILLSFNDGEYAEIKRIREELGLPFTEAVKYFFIRQRVKAIYPQLLDDTKA